MQNDWFLSNKNELQPSPDCCIRKLTRQRCGKTIIKTKKTFILDNCLSTMNWIIIQTDTTTFTRYLKTFSSICNLHESDGMSHTIWVIMYESQTCILFLTRSIGWTTQAAPAPERPPKANLSAIGTLFWSDITLKIELSQNFQQNDHRFCHFCDHNPMFF